VLGRGWVVEIEAKIVGFAIANATDGNVWAFFAILTMNDAVTDGDCTTRWFPGY